MDIGELLALGLGLQPPWKLVGQRVDTGKQPHEVYLEVTADRGAEYPCPECGRLCKARDFQEFTWRHLNIFQYHCYVTGRMPRVDCPDHGTRRIKAPWAREGSRFTLLFEQAALTLVREMPVLAVARIIGVSDTRLWRVVQYYVAQALSRMDLGGVKAVALDETASKRGHNYVTVFIDLDRKQKPVIFVTPGKGKDCLVQFRRFLREHGGDHNNIAEVVCDMSPAFLAAIGESFPSANVTVDWFHVVQLFTTAVDEVRKAEARERKLPKATRWAVLKAADGGRLTEKQQQALTELETGGFATATAWRIKELLRWIRKASSVRAAQWRIT
ncbi:MAG: hypothetical protein ACD_23C00315G0001, partial [uncultured bacterium]